MATVSYKNQISVLSAPLPTTYQKQATNTELLKYCHSLKDMKPMLTSWAVAWPFHGKTDLCNKALASVLWKDTDNWVNRYCTPAQPNFGAFALWTYISKNWPKTAILKTEA